jgi:pyruvate kinase
MTDKDSKDLLFGITHRIDMVALSFVQTPADIVQIKSMINVLGTDLPVIAKIEKLSAIDHIEEITKLSDGIMVARGDLGVEAGVERVPGLQKIITKTAAKFARPVIVATQMLESMIQNPRASLAEVADVANGVLDNADCLMLSGEVASGKYPVESVKRMASIIKEVETWQLTHDRYTLTGEEYDQKEWPEHESIARAACEAAEATDAKAIVCLTLTGSIARLIARWRPKATIIAVSPREDIVKRLTMVWGVYALRNPSFYNTDVLLQDLPTLLRDLDIVSSGDTIVVTAGIPLNQMRPTNMVKIDRIP